MKRLFAFTLLLFAAAPTFAADAQQLYRSV